MVLIIQGSCLMKKMKVAILGSGNIGTDLLIKIMRSPFLECVVFMGRNLFSNGMMKAKSLGINVYPEGIRYIKENPDCCDIVFDATSAKSHLDHAPILKQLGKFVIDLTPSRMGIMCIPIINMEHALMQKNVSMVTCGGQAAAPIAYALSKTQKDIDYVEVISSIASRSAGPATRFNIDEYIHTTEQAIQFCSGAKKTKAILNLNPAKPCVYMQTTIFAKVKSPQIETLRNKVKEITSEVQKYVPGYEIIIYPLLENDRIVTMVRVKGLGDYLPEYAGNLDIINCAALAVAEEYAKYRST